MSSPHQAAHAPAHAALELFNLRAGYGAIEVFSSLTVHENVLAAAEARRSWSRDDASPAQTASEMLERVGLRHLEHERVDMLSTGLLRLVEVARARASRPRLLLLDEPGSGLDSTESEALGDLLVELVQDGRSILLVEHDVELVMRVCHEIHVLDFGQVIAHGTPDEVQRDPAVQAAYLGTSAA